MSKEIVNRSQNFYRDIVCQPTDRRDALGDADASLSCRIGAGLHHLWQRQRRRYGTEREADR